MAAQMGTQGSGASEGEPPAKAPDKIPKFRRKILIIDKRSQLTLTIYTFIVAVLVLLVNFSIGVAWQTAQNDPDAAQTTRIMVILFSFVGGGLVVFLSMIFGMVISNQIAGPIYAIRKHMRMVINGETRKPVIFRKGDQYEELAQDYNEILVHIRKLEARLDGKKE